MVIMKNVFSITTLVVMMVLIITSIYYSDRKNSGSLNQHPRYIYLRDLKFGGDVVKKYINYSNHGAFTADFDNATSAGEIPDTIFKAMKKGDLIVKDSGQFIIYLVRKKYNDTIFYDFKKELEDWWNN